MSSDVHSKVVTRLIERLTSERLQQGLSQQALANLSGLSRTGIRHLESGDYQPTLLTFLRVADALGLDLLETFQEVRTGTGGLKKKSGKKKAM